MSESRTPSLAEVIRLAIDNRLADVHVALPASVERYNPTLQLIDAKPLLRQMVEGEDGAEVSLSLPVVTNVPVIFPGASGFRLTFPLAKGDVVLLVVSERSLDRWKTVGGEVNPVDLRTHHISDAVAIPGLHPNTKPWTGAAITHATIGKDGGPQVELKSNEIVLGGGSAKVHREGDDVDPTSAMQTWMSQVAGYINAQAPGTVTPPTPSSFGEASGGADKVKA